MLIRLIGSAFTGFIERGSLWGAALGGVIGATAGFLIAYLLRANDLLDRYWVGAAIAMALVLGFACAAAGSRLLPHDLAGRGEDVILTNFNRALVALAFLVGITAVTFLGIRGEQRQHGQLNCVHPMVIVPGVLILILLLVSVRSTLAVRVGKQIVFYRVWRTRRFSWEQVRDWGFEFARGKYTHEPPDVAPRSKSNALAIRRSKPSYRPRRPAIGGGAGRNRSSASVEVLAGSPLNRDAPRLLRA